MVVCLSAPALAWEVEDPSVADNEDFIGGGGYDDGVYGHARSGAQPWPFYKIPNEGYSLYRDDVTDTGNLDQVYFLTFTPDKIDLPIIASYGPYTAEEVGQEGLQADYPYEGLAEYWHMGGEVSPDTWYWATEPRGYDLPTVRDPAKYLTIVLPDDRMRVKLKGTRRYAGDIDFNDGTWRIQIPANVRIWRDTGGAAHKLYVLEDGTIKSGIHFSCGEPIVTRM
ncbi:unnamed protein product [marine sediment metagenome]|uniref:Uncharacterized protein n=1 Tax=marine sediment metagenome TaxID=412755 RepID=X1SDN7_9ZZZZ